MGGLSPLHWMLVLLVVVLLFGTGRISGVMGDFAKGLKAFKKNMADESDVSMEAGDRPGERPVERPAGSIAAPNLPPAAPSYAAAAAAPPAPNATPASPARPSTVDHV